MSALSITLSRPVQVLSVASEMFPYVKTGGLGDVVASLPVALADYGVQVRTLVPGYPAILAAIGDNCEVVRLPTVLGHEAHLRLASIGALCLAVLDIPALYDRPGNPYMRVDGQDWPDNGIRFAVLARAAAYIGQGFLQGYHPDLIQTHDWQGGLTAAYLHYDGDEVWHANGMSRRPRVVQTIHNLAFHGSFAAEEREAFGLPIEAMNMDGCEFHGKISFLKAGLYFADWITTVSPTYAQEIQGEQWGMGLDGLLRARSSRLSGILNGLDTTVWNPAHDPSVRFPYRLGDIASRMANKLALQSEFGLPQDRNAFLVGIVSRLTSQKGVDLLPDIMERLLHRNTQFVVVGEGDRSIHRAFFRLQRAYPGRFACYLGYSEELGHRFQASVDALLVPSRFEPCGLTQLCALRYGAVPIVSQVGGLADTIVDANEAAINQGVGTGFLFSPVSCEMLATTIEKARALFRGNRKAWIALQRNGAATDVSWSGKAAQYARLFASLAEVDLETAQDRFSELPSPKLFGGSSIRRMARQGRQIARKPGPTRLGLLSKA